MFRHYRATFFVIFILILLITVYHTMPDRKRHTRKLNIEWGTSFGTQMESTLIKRECVVAGAPMCCDAIQDNRTELAASHFVPPHHAKKTQCKTTRNYISSPYELRHYQYSLEYQNITDWWKRREAYVMLMLDEHEVEADKKWLERVRIHMESGDVPEPTADDHEYLSRFEVTRTCTHETPDELGRHETVQTWNEWIEPITIHTRHPFSFGNCKVPKYNLGGEYAKRGMQPVSIVNNDYILIQTAKSLYHNFPYQTSDSHTRKAKHYLFDAGTSTFESSLYWFVCAYFQRYISFDQIYGWEMTLLEPNTFWQRVPDIFVAIYHFFNVPIEADHNNKHSVLRIIKQIASEDDFVAFKLDIDAPTVEVPIAIDIANNYQNISQYVDEFFFELHYRCELMMHCAWGVWMPDQMNGLILHKPYVLDFFMKMRRLGIRSHFWP